MPVALLHWSLNPQQHHWRETPFSCVKRHPSVAVIKEAIIAAVLSVAVAPRHVCLIWRSLYTFMLIVLTIEG